MIDMSKNVDVFVCQPDLGITESLKAVFVTFERMNPATLEGIGTAHTVAMTTSDAMQLLSGLQLLQERHHLPSADEPYSEVDLSPRGKN
jgi:hypothetical protein